MTSLTIAVVASAPGPGQLTQLPPDEVWKMPFAQRSQIQLRASGDETLAHVLSRAIVDLGYAIQGRPPFLPSAIAFRRPQDDDAAIGGSTYVLAVVQPDGTALWRHYGEVTVDELLASADAGAVHGDPLQIYAVMIPPIGNGVLPSWPDLVHAFAILRTVLEILAVPGSVAATYELIKQWRRRSARVVDALETHSPTWADRGLDPYYFDRWLDEIPWHLQDLAALLGSSVAEAEAVLWAFGFTPATSGLWRRENDEEATTLTRLKDDLIGATSRDATDEQFASEMERRFQHLVATGSAPPAVPWEELAWTQKELPGDSAHQARSSSTFAARLKRLGKRRG